MNTDRPLDALDSIRVKIGVLVVASILTATFVAYTGSRAGVSGWVSLPVTIVAALAITQWLARGMVAPLREMTAAASAMAGGDYRQRVAVNGTDEVGALARAFNTMATELAEADTQRRQLIATVSHELRTPLTAQRALLENLVDGVAVPSGEQLQAALDQSDRLTALVSDLLDLSRIDAGARLLDLAEVRVTEVLSRAVAEAQVAGREVTHVVHVDPPDLRATVDLARFNQLVANLLDNAARHSPREGRIGLSANLSGGRRWVLEVSDEGPGIPAENADAVFGRFGTGDDSGGGTGLGLAIARWVAQLHGGDVAVVPTPAGERGAHLRVVLPLDPPVRVPTTEEAVVPETASPTGLAPAPAPGKPSGSQLPDDTDAPDVPGVPVLGGRGAAGAPVAASGSGFVDAFFGRSWPERDPAPRPGLLLGAIGLGVLAGILVPYRSMGLGVFIVLLAAAAVIHAPVRRRRSPWFLTCLAVCVGLASLVVLRGSEVLGVLGVLTAAVVTASNLVEARTVSAVVAAPLTWMLSGVRGLPLLGRTLTAARKLSGIYPVLRTAGISLVALVVFGGLFASADAIFGSWVSRLVPDLGWDQVIVRPFVGFVAGGVTLAGAYLALNPPRMADSVVPLGRPLRNRYEWLVPLSLVSVVFVVFHVAQASAMWGGHAYVQRTAGLTYAQYVHQGFAQLTIATLLTLLVVALVVRKADQSVPGDRLALRVAVSVQGVLTLGVVASALYRMALYQEAYGYSTMRVFVDGFEGWLGLLVLVVVAAVWLPRLRCWTGRIALLSGALLVLGYGLMNPAAWVAGRNIDRFEAGRQLDARYLVQLTPDATAVIADRLPEPLARCIIGQSTGSGIDDPFEWNLGRARDLEARRALAVGSTPRELSPECEALMGDPYAGD